MAIILYLCIHIRIAHYIETRLPFAEENSQEVLSGGLMKGDETVGAEAIDSWPRKTWISAGGIEFEKAWK